MHFRLAFSIEKIIWIIILGSLKQGTGGQRLLLEILSQLCLWFNVSMWGSKDLLLIGPCGARDYFVYLVSVQEVSTVAGNVLGTMYCRDKIMFSYAPGNCLNPYAILIDTSLSICNNNVGSLVAIFSYKLFIYFIYYWFYYWLIKVSPI